MNSIQPNRQTPVLFFPEGIDSQLDLFSRLGPVVSAVSRNTILASEFQNCLASITEHAANVLLICGWNTETHGGALIRRFRQNLPAIKILVIGSKDLPNERLAAFEAGADNFLFEDFNAPELIAYLRHCLKQPIANEVHADASNLQIWSDMRVVIKDGNLIKLGPKEMDILLCLNEARPQPVPRAQLLKKVFGREFDPGTNAVEVHIHRLRQKLETLGAPKVIETLRGQGYRLN